VSAVIILGIDPGTAITGYGIVVYEGNHYHVVSYGVLNSSKTEAPASRLNKIYEGINSLIDTHRPDAMAIEELFFNKNAKTVIQVGQARGVALLAAQRRHLSIFEYTPLQVKQAVVGYGRAEKQQVQFMVKAILNLQEIPRPDDAADALAIAICHGHFASSGYYTRIKEM
jgi:crossover junction endodeoxyribonuclease RuvC